MTTDAFTTAARDHANTTWQVAGEAWARRIFMEGAEWARDHLATQEPTDAEVEAAKAVLDAHEYADEPQAIRDALTAAKEAR